MKMICKRLSFSNYRGLYGNERVGSSETQGICSYCFATSFLTCIPGSALYANTCQKVDSHFITAPHRGGLERKWLKKILQNNRTSSCLLGREEEMSWDADLRWFIRTASKFISWSRTWKEQHWKNGNKEERALNKWINKVFNKSVCKMTQPMDISQFLIPDTLNACWWVHKKSAEGQGWRLHTNSTMWTPLQES